MAWLCLPCKMFGLLRVFPPLTVSSLHLLHCLRLTLAGGYYSFSFFFFGICKTDKHSDEQCQQAASLTLVTRPLMDNGFPAQGGMLEMSVRNRERPIVCS